MGSKDSLHSIRIGCAGRNVTISLIEPPSTQPPLSVQLGRGVYSDHVDARIEVVVDGFRASYITDLFGVDFPAFRAALARLYSFESQEAFLDPIEGELTIDIKGDGRGHFTAKCVARKHTSETFPCLTFNLEFDQTEIPAMLAELDAVLERVP